MLFFSKSSTFSSKPVGYLATLKGHLSALFMTHWITMPMSFASSPLHALRWKPDEMSKRPLLQFSRLWGISFSFYEVAMLEHTVRQSCTPELKKLNTIKDGNNGMRRSSFRHHEEEDVVIAPSIWRVKFSPSCNSRYSTKTRNPWKIRRR